MSSAVANRERGLPGLIGLGGLVGLGIGLAALAPSPIFGFDPLQALAGAAGQLATTLPAAATVLVAMGLELAAGLTILRFARREPFTSVSDALLSGLLGAVLKDVALLGFLGQVGRFDQPILLAVDAAILVAGAFARPLVRFRPAAARSWRPRLGVILLGLAVGLVWLGPLLLQLANPVVPFIDVLPNHVAPAEHLRAFGSFDPLSATQSPIYGPSRTLLGFVALAGAVSTMTGLPAVLALAALILPSTVLIAAGIHRLAGSIGGSRAAWWSLLTFALTASFARIGDVRATVVVLPLVAWVLAALADRAVDRAADRTVSEWRLPDGVLLGLGLGAAVLVHPVIGALSVGVVALVVVFAPSRLGRTGITGVAVAAVMGLPQGLTMLGVSLPAISLLVGVVAAVPVGFVVDRAPRIRSRRLPVRPSAIVVVGFAFLAGAFILASIADVVVGQLVPENGLLVAVAVAGLVVKAPAIRSPVVLAAVAVGIMVAIVTALIPAGASLLGDALRFELPKTLYYWLPVFAALAAGSTLATLRAGPGPVVPTPGRRRPIFAALAAGSTLATLRAGPGPVVPTPGRRRPILRRAGTSNVAVGLVVVAAALPLRAESIDAFWLGDHRLSETLAIDLHVAQAGFWINFPNRRTLVDASRMDLLDAVRAEIDAGRIGPDTAILHVASSFQEWVATPLGVFTGVTETDVSLDPEQSIHTVGGRLHPLSDLPAMLADRAYPYVLLEPSFLLPPDLGDSIIAAGYVKVYANSQGVLYRLTGA